ncbi:N-acetyltransferase esco2 [Linnemannia zychae]|nr:N-acetyltransferase esco2 [Linnemannia zychae]
MVHSSSSSAVGEAWMTPTRGTRKLIDELKRAKLDLDHISSSSSDGDNDDDDDDDDSKGKEEDLENVFKVRKQSSIIPTTPSRKRSQQEDEEEKDVSDADMGDGDRASQQRTPIRQRKRQLLDLDDSSPVRRSPRSAQGQGKLERQGSSGSSSRTSRPRSTSPSPPASPTRRSTRTSLVFPTLPTPADSTSRAALSSSSSTTDSSSKGETKKPGQQVTISSFFTTKAGAGTGILKARIGAPSSNGSSQKPTSSSNTASPADTDTRDQQVAIKKTGPGPSTLQEPPKKLEQLFLAFSKDRTKSNTSANNNATSVSSKQRPAAATARRPNQLIREDEKLKRYHCPQCGMPYVRGQPEDEQIHDRYHRAALGGIDYPGYKNEVVVARFRDLEVETNGGRNGGGSVGSVGVKGNSTLSSSSSSIVWGDAANSRIVMVSMSDSSGTASSVSASGSNFEKKKVKEVLEVVNKELGSVEFDPEKLDSCKVFLYISGKKKVVGCLIAERIKEGFEIMTLGIESEGTLNKARTGSATSMNTSGGSGGGGAAIFCSKRFIYACKLEPKDLAFSQPTGDGKALARQYLGTERFLVYVE